ncbi:hypothetical protein CAPI_07795 [Corynebacterium capitovis DSM 44611]|uniref:GNAT family N-acetyltransferase n=1 Tax=Corynebacterium capitovis TaxID=131081 RepID=UPI00037582AE|nr:GNAT family N-acetyltransferase [Corynebacterium capitovis]WKD58092.1 hypothetical protein CAPI_07795 [Corynebacterium capitovis DSM 44611]
MAEQPEFDLRDNPDESRYELRVGGEVAGFASYKDHEGVRVMPHTVVYPKYRGQGLSKPLIAFALDDVSSRGLRVTPACSAVERFIEQNPDYQSLVSAD